MQVIMPVPVGIALAHSEKVQHHLASRKAQKPVECTNKNICGSYLAETRLKQKILFNDDRRDIETHSQYRERGKCNIQPVG